MLNFAFQWSHFIYLNLRLSQNFFTAKPNGWVWAFSNIFKDGIQRQQIVFFRVEKKKVFKNLFICIGLCECSRNRIELQIGKSENNKKNSRPPQPQSIIIYVSFPWNIKRIPERRLLALQQSAKILGALAEKILSQFQRPPSCWRSEPS